MPRILDSMWEFGELDVIPDTGVLNRMYLTCKLCGKHMSGGINKLKLHLGQIPSQNIELCTKTSPEIIRQAIQSLMDKEEGKDTRAAVRNQLVGGSRVGRPDSGSASTAASPSSPMSIHPSISSFFVPRTTHGSQLGIKSSMKKKEKAEADKLVSRCLLWGDVPFNIAKTNPFYQPMFDVVAVVGPGYKAPTFAELRGPLLQNEKTECTTRLAEFRASWEYTGCTVMSNGWTDQKGRTLLNFLVSCPKGTMFMKSVDASDHIKDARLLCELLDLFIQEVGPSNVVQVITDNVANYVAAGKMLMERYPNLFWTPCGAHCIDLMLEDIGKIPTVRDIVESSKSITKFIYNHSSALSLMRKCTNNKELVRPAITRIATTFISLQSLLNSMWEVKSMFLSADWRSLSISRKPEGEGICGLVSYDQSFWAGVEELCAISEPLVKVLQLVDGEKPAMGYLYEAMDRAKEAIRAYYADKGDEGLEKQQVIWRVIDQRWNNTLHRPIHAAGVYLNPAFSYACGFRFDAEVMDGFFTCVERMVSSEQEREEISKEMEVYRMGGGTFGFNMAIKNRSTKMPDAWWTSYGGRVPHLQKLAIRVLSQTCSSSGCERNWSVFDKIHSNKRNRLESKRLNDMVYVYYNLWLWVRQLQKPTDVEAISLDNIDTTAARRVETERPILDTIPDWLGVDLEDVAVAEEGEPKIEEEEAEQHQGQEAVAELDEDAEEEVTPSRVGSSSGSVAQGPPLPSASRGRLSPFHFVSPGAGSSSSRGKDKAIPYSRKRGRGSQ
eukprot:PITA_04357